MNKFMILSNNVHYKIISYLYPKISCLRLINKKFLKYIRILLKKGRILNIDDVVEFFHINFQKIINFLDKCPYYKFIRLNYINDHIDVCELIKHATFQNKMIYISNSKLCVYDDIQTHELHFHNCAIINLIDKIKIKNVKYVIFENTYNSSTYILSLELSNVDSFIYTNEHKGLYNYTQTTIQIDENCNNFIIYNRQKDPMKIIHKDNETFLQFGDHHHYFVNSIAGYPFICS